MSSFRCQKCDDFRVHITFYCVMAVEQTLSLKGFRRITQESELDFNRATCNEKQKQSWSFANIMDAGLQNSKVTENRHDRGTYKAIRNKKICHLCNLSKLLASILMTAVNLGAARRRTLHHSSSIMLISEVQCCS